MKLKKKTWWYILAVTAAVVFNAAYAAWPSFESQIDPTIWASINAALGVVVAVIRTWGVLFGIPTSVESLEKDTDENA